MAAPIEKTFELLATTSSPGAVGALIAALDVHSERVRELAAGALLRRTESRGHLELIRKLATLPESAQELVRERAERLEHSLRQCLVRGAGEMRANSLALVREARLYRLVPALLEILTSESADSQDEAAEIVTELVNYVYACGRGEQVPGAKYLRSAERATYDIVMALDHACGRFDALSHREQIVELLLACGNARHSAVSKVFLQAARPCRELAARLLMDSAHPGVIDLLLASLSQNHPLAAMLAAIEKRNDTAFVHALLEWFPKRLTVVQCQNLRRIRSLEWLAPGPDVLDALSPPHQEKAAELVAATGLPEAQKLAVHEWLVRHGSAAGRLAASNVLANLDGETVTEIIFEGLESADAQVEAWATRLLRTRQVPEAIQILLTQLDNPRAEVQQAARDELAGFDFALLMELHDQIDERLAPRLGELLQKVNPDCREELAGALSNSVRRQRLRAADAIRALGLQGLVVPEILAMTQDEDAFVRRKAAELLEAIDGSEAINALAALLEDDSPRVREAAMQALVHHDQALTAQNGREAW